jgi:hypothetical protein
MTLFDLNIQRLTTMEQGSFVRVTSGKATSDRIITRQQSAKTGESAAISVCVRLEVTCDVHLRATVG